MAYAPGAYMSFFIVSIVIAHENKNMTKVIYKLFLFSLQD